jgi:hypothetical protein
MFGPLCTFVKEEPDHAALEVSANQLPGQVSASLGLIT